MTAALPTSGRFVGHCVGSGSCHGPSCSLIACHLSHNAASGCGGSCTDGTWSTAGARSGAWRRHAASATARTGHWRSSAAVR